MYQVFTCSYCRRAIQAPFHMQGQQIPCPSCSTFNTVPLPNNRNLSTRNPLNLWLIIGGSVAAAMILVIAVVALVFVGRGKNNSPSAANASPPATNPATPAIPGVNPAPNAAPSNPSPGNKPTFDPNDFTKTAQWMDDIQRRYGDSPGPRFSFRGKQNTANDAKAEVDLTHGTWVSKTVTWNVTVKQRRPEGAFGAFRTPPHIELNEERLDIASRHRRLGNDLEASLYEGEHATPQQLLQAQAGSTITITGTVRSIKLVHVTRFGAGPSKNEVIIELTNVKVQ